MFTKYAFIFYYSQENTMLQEKSSGIKKRKLNCSVIITEIVIIVVILYFVYSLFVLNVDPFL